MTILPKLNVTVERLGHNVTTLTMNRQLLWKPGAALRAIRESSVHCSQWGNVCCAKKSLGWPVSRTYYRCLYRRVHFCSAKSEEAAGALQISLCQGWLKLRLLADRRALLRSKTGVRWKHSFVQYSRLYVYTWCSKHLSQHFGSPETILTVPALTSSPTWRLFVMWY